ncbi:MAG: NAD(P)-dependent glycerol-3-phosphate dehydrogenase [Candidatus Omnitrophica bacterium]|nr:NAD(P)-dependent glycerol-3-phosphate dehydrogenase [Candidatus Omnitrophota bacterium]
MRIAVLGDGGWGTTLAVLLNKKGYNVTLWGAFPEYVRILKAKRENKKFLPGIKLPYTIILEHDIGTAVRNKDIVVLAVPSQHMREVLKKIPKFTPLGCKPRQPIGQTRRDGPVYVSAAKGIENKTLLRMSEVIRQELGDVKLAVLSGPTISYEVARGIPTTAVVAAKNSGIAKQIQGVFSTEQFRVYASTDVAGVELGGSLKNIIAIAAGIADGLGFGTNSKAALLTRGLVEITRLGVAMGAKKETFAGLSGLGDLVTTCINPHGRNRWFGEQVGKGKSPKAVLKETEMVIEGIPTTKSAYSLAKRYRVEVPITEQVYSVLYKNKSPKAAVRELMLRPRKKE